MTLEQLKKYPAYQTATIAEALKDPDTLKYVFECLGRFFAGDYGEICQEDTDANNQDLEDGEGHILARYKKGGKLQSDIYIEAHFSESVPGLDANNIMIMYPSER